MPKNSTVRQSAQTRQFGRFMGQVLQPVEVESEDPMTRMRNAQTIDDYHDEDLLWLLRGEMIKAGVPPLSTADNILAHLRERVSKAGRLGAH